MSSSTRELNGILLGPSLEIGSGSLESSVEAILARDPLNTVGRVDVLDQDDLVASGRTLARDDGRVGKEVLPDLRK
jgi:hypothetical protein